MNIFLWCFYKRSNLKFSGKDQLFFLGQGFFLFFLNYIACYVAGQYIESGLNAIGFSMVLFFNILNSFLFYRTPLTLPVFVGSTLGFIGIMTTFSPALQKFDLSDTGLIGVLLSLLGGVFASFGNMISARNQKHNIPVMESNAYAMGYGALLMLGVICIKGIPFQFEWTMPYTLSLLYLALFGSIVA